MNVNMQVEAPKSDAKAFTRAHDSKVYVILDNSDRVVVFDPSTDLPRLSTRWSKDEVLTRSDVFQPVTNGTMTITFP